MHYYQFNIGDYSSHTNHLDPLEDIAYRRMMDWCYLHESPLPSDIKEIARLIRMREECERIEDVLREFFYLDEDSYRHKRVDIEVEKYHDKSTKAKASAKARWDKHANALPTDSESNTNHKPLTTNQEPSTKKHKPRTNKQKTKEQYIYTSWPEIPEKQIFEDWIAMRKRKKAAISQTVINSFGKELHKAASQGISVNECITECVTRNWTGFKAEWIKAGRDEKNLNQWMKDEINANTFEVETLGDEK